MAWAIVSRCRSSPSACPLFPGFSVTIRPSTETTSASASRLPIIGLFARASPTICDQTARIFAAVGSSFWADGGDGGAAEGTAEGAGEEAGDDGAVELPFN